MVGLGPGTCDDDAEDADEKPCGWVGLTLSMVMMIIDDGGGEGGGEMLMDDDGRSHVDPEESKGETSATAPEKAPFLREPQNCG